MAKVISSLVALAAAGLVLGGCGGCERQSSPVDAGAKRVAKVEEPKDAEPEEKPVDLSVPNRQVPPTSYVEGTQVATPTKPLSLVRMPAVSAEDLQDPRLPKDMNPRKKRTLKLLEKLQKNHPLFKRKKDFAFEAIPDHDTRAPGGSAGGSPGPKGPAGGGQDQQPEP